MTKAQTRREALLRLLRESSAPLAGGALAEQLGVSRQIIVQDIALLREAGANIVATTKGYVLADAASAAEQPESTDAEGAAPAEPFELETIISAGGRVKNVSISHRAYGRVTAPLNITTQADIDRFMQDIESGKSSPLCTATSGYHYHLIAADSEEALETIGRALADEGYLAPLLPHEQG